MCTSYIDKVKALADTNHDGTISQNEALLLTLDIVEAVDKPYAQVTQYDINADGSVNSVDTSIILSALDTLAPSN